MRIVYFVTDHRSNPCLDIFDGYDVRYMCESGDWRGFGFVCGSPVVALRFVCVW